MELLFILLGFFTVLAAVYLISSVNCEYHEKYDQNKFNGNCY